jgi:hypothetical protein
VPYLLTSVFLGVSAVLLWQGVAVSAYAPLHSDVLLDMHRLVFSTCSHVFSTTPAAPQAYNQTLTSFDLDTTFRQEVQLVLDDCLYDCSPVSMNAMYLVVQELPGAMQSGLAGRFWVNLAVILQALEQRKDRFLQFALQRNQQAVFVNLGLVLLLVGGMIILLASFSFLVCAWIYKDEYTNPFFRFEKGDLDLRYKLICESLEHLY